MIRTTLNSGVGWTEMQVILEKADGTRVPVTLAKFGIGRIKLDELVKQGKVYHVIKTDKVEVISVSQLYN